MLQDLKVKTRKLSLQADAQPSTLNKGSRIQDFRLGVDKQASASVPIHLLPKPIYDKTDDLVLGPPTSRRSDDNLTKVPSNNDIRHIFGLFNSIVSTLVYFSATCNPPISLPRFDLCPGIGLARKTQLGYVGMFIDVAIPIKSMILIRKVAPPKYID